MIGTYVDWAVAVPEDKYESIARLLVHFDACQVALTAGTPTGSTKWSIWKSTGTPAWVDVHTSSNIRANTASGLLNLHTLELEEPLVNGYLNEDGHLYLAARFDVDCATFRLDMNHVGLSYQVNRSHFNTMYNGTAWALWDGVKQAFVLPTLEAGATIDDYRFVYKKVKTLNNVAYTASFDMSIKDYLKFVTPTVQTDVVVISYSGNREPIVATLDNPLTRYARYAAMDDGSNVQESLHVTADYQRDEQVDLSGTEWDDPESWAIGMFLQDGLTAAGGLMMKYNYPKGDAVDLEPTNVPGTNYFPMAYMDNEMRHASLCMLSAEECVEPGVPLTIAYKAVKGELARRFIVSADSRIDQGVAKKAATTIYVSAELDQDAAANTNGVISGPGVALPGA